jgi:predicted nicotinamide N-methyase
MSGYQTKQEQLKIAGLDDMTFRSLLDKHQYSDPSGESLRLGISSAFWPLFGLLWPSGAELARLIARRPINADETILELGCGLGLASLVAHRLGADVTASDCHPLAGAFLLENVRLNALKALKYRHGHWNPPPAGCVFEGDPVREPVVGRFDLIIGSDLLYERDPAGGLASFIDQHAAVCAEVWIVDPDRRNRAIFSRQMLAKRFTLIERRLDHGASAYSGAYKGRLLQFNRF